jgi:hypothetical protein
MDRRIGGQRAGRGHGAGFKRTLASGLAIATLVSSATWVTADPEPPAGAAAKHNAAGATAPQAFVGPPAPRTGINDVYAPPPRHKVPSTRSLLIHYGTGAGFDLLSTEWAMAQHPGVSEQNPLLRSSGIRATAKILEVGGAALIDKRISVHHPRLAKILRWVYFASRMAAGIHNVQVGLKEKNRGARP